MSKKKKEVARETTPVSPNQGCFALLVVSLFQSNIKKFARRIPPPREDVAVVNLGWWSLSVREREGVR